MSELEVFTIEGRARKLDNGPEGVSSGKSYTRKARAAGWLPANIIGKGKSQPIEIQPKLLEKVFMYGGRKFELELSGKKQMVKVHELQLHPVKRTPLHVDLMSV